MTVATFTQTNNTNQSGAQYLANLDGDIAVHQQIAGAFAPHFDGCTGATCSFATSVMTVVTAPTSGIFAPGQTIVAVGVTTGTTITGGSYPTFNLSTTPGTIATEGVSSASMSIKVDGGSVFNAPVLTAVNPQTTASFSIPAAGYFRIDRVVLDPVTGTAYIISGTPTTGTPSAPAIPSGRIPCAQVSLNSSMTSIYNSYITDERIFLGLTKPQADATYAQLAGLSTQAFSTAGLTATGLVDLSNAAAGQVKFPATQNPSTDPNTLDDYEEGTWTPNVGGTATYSSQIGTYTKIGRSVSCGLYLDINVIGTGATGLVYGLPFTSASFTYSEWPVLWQFLTSAVTTAMLDIIGGSTQGRLMTTAAAANTISYTPVLGSSSQIFSSGSYITT